MQLTALKKEMRFNAEMLSLVDTLKNIAASRYHSLERSKERFELFMDSFSGFFKIVDLAGIDDPLVRSVTDVLGIIAVTSDSGFMGGLNAGVVDAALSAQGDLSNERVQLVVIGEKGAAKFADVGRSFKFFSGISDETRYEQAIEMTDYVTKEVLERRIGRLVMVHPKPVSFSQQVIRTIKVLPCADLFDRAAASQIPETAAKEGVLSKARRVIVESSFSDMVEYLARTWVAAKLYEVFEDSKLAEYGARAIHLEGSRQKLEKEQKKLQSRFFRASHEKIDKGMRESFSSANIKKKRKKTEDRAVAAEEANEAA